MSLTWIFSFEFIRPRLHQLKRYPLSVCLECVRAAYRALSSRGCGSDAYLMLNPLASFTRTRQVARSLDVFFLQNSLYLCNAMMQSELAEVMKMLCGCCSN